LKFFNPDSELRISKNPIKKFTPHVRKIFLCHKRYVTGKKMIYPGMQRLKKKCLTNFQSCESLK